VADLTPAAQAVLDAADSAFEQAGTTRQGIAAVLRAAADQVVPVELHPEVYEDCCQYSDVQTRAGIRSEILTIATELEAT
jgi:hypothetical protein